MILFSLLCLNMIFFYHLWKFPQYIFNRKKVTAILVFGSSPPSPFFFRILWGLNTISKILEKLCIGAPQTSHQSIKQFVYFPVSLSSVSQHGNCTVEDSVRCLLLNRRQANNVSCRLGPIGCFCYYWSRNPDSSSEVKFRRRRQIIVLDFFLHHWSMAACEIRWHQLNSSQMWVRRSSEQCPRALDVYCLRSTRCKRHSFVWGVVSSICRRHTVIHQCATEVVHYSIGQAGQV